MISAIVRERLENQLFGTGGPRRAAEVVAWLGAVQAQDYGAAKWALGMRAARATDEVVEDAFNRGAFLRTHVMRPTWHFIAPPDLRPVLALTRRRAQQANGTMYRRLELDAKTLSRCRRVLSASLRDRCYRTRAELGARLEESGIRAHGQRLAYILMHAEFEALITSGPRRGKQFTYALTDDRVPATPAAPRDETLAGWAHRYARSHGPVQARDFAWWCALTLEEANRAFRLAGDRVAAETVDGRTYWRSTEAPRKPGRLQRALLLSIYDEYTIAYRDRSALGAGRWIERFISMGNLLTSALVMDGLVAGTWKRTAGARRMDLVVQPFRSLAGHERTALGEAVARYERFHGVSVRLRMGAVGAARGGR